MIYFIQATGKLRGFLYSNLAYRYIFTDYEDNPLEKDLSRQLACYYTSRIQDKIEISTKDDLDMLLMIYADRPHKGLEKAWLRLKDKEDRVIRGYHD